MICASLSGAALALGILALAALGIANAFTSTRGSSSMVERRAAAGRGTLPPARPSTEISVRSGGPASHDRLDEETAHMALYPTTGRRALGLPPGPPPEARQ